ncbi:hypothetical protein Pfo_015094 [Paulownia fortunei]|nr:hypothetical protein Pfo_015094 [Paulownia fortunei]
MDAAGTSSSKGTEGHVEQPHVLVVDDCRVSRMRNEMMFKKYSCKVTTAESGLKALEFLGLADDNQRSGNDNQIPKLNMVSTDYNMPPGMNGYELLKKIKQESSTMKDVPVVIVSSAEDPDLINK